MLASSAVMGDRRHCAVPRAVAHYIVLRWLRARRVTEKRWASSKIQSQTSRWSYPIWFMPIYTFNTVVQRPTQTGLRPPGMNRVACRTRSGKLIHLVKAEHFTGNPPYSIRAQAASWVMSQCPPWSDSTMC